MLLTVDIRPQRTEDGTHAILDQTNITNAYVSGMKEDLNLGRWDSQRFREPHLLTLSDTQLR